MYLVACCRFLITMAGQKIGAAADRERGGIGAGVLQGLGMREFGNIFAGCEWVTGGVGNGG
jgi:hypothetical protein